EIIDTPVIGLRLMALRLSKNPDATLAWYASKIWHLWDWNVRISADASGIHIHHPLKTPLTAPPLVYAVQLTRALNPALFVLSLAVIPFALRQRDEACMV